MKQEQDIVEFTPGKRKRGRPRRLTTDFRCDHKNKFGLRCKDPRILGSPFCEKHYMELQRYQGSEKRKQQDTKTVEEEEPADHQVDKDIEVRGVKGVDIQKEDDLKRKSGDEKAQYQGEKLPLLQYRGKKLKSDTPQTQALGVPFKWKGTENEAANNNLMIVQMDCTQLLRFPVVGHQSPLRLEKSDPPTLEYNDNQLMPNEIILRDASMKSFTDPNSNEFHDKAVQCSTSVTANTYPSPGQKERGPLPLENASLPFVKRSEMWDLIESKEVFKLIPQHPHFRPLERHGEECREEIALRHMLSFALLFERTCKADFGDPRSVFENKLQLVTDFEKLGFTVQPIRSRLEELLKIKNDYSELDDSSKTADTEVTDEKRRIDEIQESITRLNMELQALQTEKEARVIKAAELQRTADEIKERISGGRRHFDCVVASPW